MSKYVALAQNEVAWLRSQADQVGANEFAEQLAKQLGIDNRTVISAIAGARVQRMTARIIRQHLVTVPAVEL